MIWYIAASIITVLALLIAWRSSPSASDGMGMGALVSLQAWLVALAVSVAAWAVAWMLS